MNFSSEKQKILRNTIRNVYRECSSGVLCPYSEFSGFHGQTLSDWIAEQPSKREVRMHLPLPTLPKQIASKRTSRT